MTEEIFATCLFNILTLFCLDGLFICIVSPSDVVIKWIEVINRKRIHGNEAPLTGKKQKFIVDVKCLREENQTGALIL